MLSLTTSENSKSMLPNIQRLDLSNNKISGVWSWNMGNDAMWNRFHGTISQTFLKGNAIKNLDFNGCSKIKSLFMSLRIIDLAHNDFDGDLPEMYLRSLKAIMNIDERNMTRKYIGDSYYQDSITVTTKGLEVELLKS
ncbi:hypothetical protein CK203_088724 [Vitis vinifera]|uniref:Uncharacterized protein n=1 Tax=Vitis vinifera TaxID=29760 RepID=A0A438CLQ0_VITVI|nr:hypothetical protein CK203_088724 [Vitis vinifera]